MIDPATLTAGDIILLGYEDTDFLSIVVSSELEETRGAYVLTFTDIKVVCGEGKLEQNWMYTHRNTYAGVYKFKELIAHHYTPEELVQQKYPEYFL